MKDICDCQACEMRRINTVRIPWKMVGTMILAVLLIGGCHKIAYGYEIIEGHTTDQWANAIRHAEGNSNYGILAHYKHTTYRQACINTVRHKYRQWCNIGHPGGFLGYLASKYAPIGCNT